jgi:hypothetical protein
LNIDVANTHQSQRNVFSHAGWNRLVIVVAVAYVIVVACLVIRERSTINPFDQFDHWPPGYVFWRWSAKAFLDTGEHHLVPRVGFIAKVMFLPPLAFALLVYAALWIYHGFRISGRSSG